VGGFSRAKGGREERSLVHHLQDKGFDAKRVPLSGMMRGYKHDIDAIKNGEHYTIELKTRNSSFKSVYAFYRSHVDAGKRCSFTVANSTKLVDIHTDFDALIGIDKDWDFSYPVLEENRTTKKIINLDKLRAGADYLVIRDNNQPFLFLRYR